MLERIRRFVSTYPESVVIEMTRTMLDKNIVDAVYPLRRALEAAGIHEYGNQEQGPAGKVAFSTKFIGSRGGESSLQVQMRAYRPVTKRGDPRFSIEMINKHLKEGDTLAIGANRVDGIVMANLSTLSLRTLEDALVSAARDDSVGGEPLDRLLNRLGEIASERPLRAVCLGSTAVGRTMEAALGIEMNSSKDPDWEGLIELKFSRPRPAQRKNLFARVPNWALSGVASFRELLDQFGYPSGGLRRLNVTVGAAPNRQGLFLSVSDDGKFVHEVSADSGRNVLTWEMETLTDALVHKHSETCWVTCLEVEIDGESHFVPRDAIYTRTPQTELVGMLIESGDITVDHVIKERGSGAHERGPLWKVSAREHFTLLPKSREATFVPNVDLLRS